MLFHFALEYAITKVQEKVVGLKLNGTNELLAYADYVNLLEDNIDTIKKNKNFNDNSKKVGLEVNAVKTKYMLLSHYQITGQRHDIKIANISFENVSQFKYLGMTVTNTNLFWEEIKRQLNSGNVFYYSVQNLLCSGLLSKNVKIRMYKTVILPVVLYGSETWSLTLRDEYLIFKVI
jgi:hypothetical protein